MQRLEPQTGTAFELSQGQHLRVIDVEGEQVADLAAFARDDKAEWLSSGRSIDYAGKIYLSTGDVLYSNRSRPMFTILTDDVGRHDFLLTPCSREMFAAIYRVQNHPSCFDNLAAHLARFGISPDAIPTTFNIFMNVEIEAARGKMSILPPRSKAGDAVTLRAEMNLIVGLTACSAELSNNYKLKPIGYEIL